MNYAVNPISSTHSILKYRPRKIRDQAEFIEQVACCARISIHTNSENPCSDVDVPADIQKPKFSTFG